MVSVSVTCEQKSSIARLAAGPLQLAPVVSHSETRLRLELPCRLVRDAALTRPLDVLRRQGRSFFPLGDARRRRVGTDFPQVDPFNWNPLAHLDEARSGSSSELVHERS